MGAGNRSIQYESAVQGREGLARVVLEVGFQANHRQTLSRRVQARSARQNTARPPASSRRCARSGVHVYSVQ